MSINIKIVSKVTGLKSDDHFNTTILHLLELFGDSLLVDKSNALNLGIYIGENFEPPLSKRLRRALDPNNSFSLYEELILIIVDELKKSGQKFTEINVLNFILENNHWCESFSIQSKILDVLLHRTFDTKRLDMRGQLLSSSILEKTIKTNSGAFCFTNTTIERFSNFVNTLTTSINMLDDAKRLALMSKVKVDSSEISGSEGQITQCKIFTVILKECKMRAKDGIITLIDLYRVISNSIYFPLMTDTILKVVSADSQSFNIIEFYSPASDT